MRLSGKMLLMIVRDGVEESEYMVLRSGFEKEGATVITAAPERYGRVRTSHGEASGRDIVVDIPFEAIEGLVFDGLIVPESISLSEVHHEKKVRSLVDHFYRLKLPIFASGSAADFLGEEVGTGGRLIIREGTPVSDFVAQAVEILVDETRLPYLYRATMSA